MFFDLVVVKKYDCLSLSALTIYIENYPHLGNRSKLVSDHSIASLIARRSRQVKKTGKQQSNKEISQIQKRLFHSLLEIWKFIKC